MAIFNLFCITCGIQIEGHAYSSMKKKGYQCETCDELEELEDGME